MHNTSKFIRSVVFVAALATLPNLSMAAQVEERPGAGAMAVDFLVARPIGLVMFGLGTVTYVATLPFSLLGGNAAEAGAVLVVGPARETFVRCLGCRLPGRKQEVRR